MPALALPTNLAVRRCLALERRLQPAALLGVALLLLALALPPSALRVAGLAAGAAALVAVLSVWAVTARHRRLRATAMEAIRGFLHHDDAPVLVSDRDGRVHYRNLAARDRFGSAGEATLAAILGTLFAAPAATLRDLQERAQGRGMAFEDRASRNGHMRLSVFCRDADLFLWRLEDVSPRAAGAGSLDLALPVAVAGRGGRIVAGNAAFRAEMGDPPRDLSALFGDLPVRSGAVQVVTTPQGPRRFRVFEAAVGDDGAELYFLPSDFGGQADPAELFDTLPVPLLKLARDGEIVMSNRGARALLGAATRPGARLSDLLSGLGRSVRDWLEEAAAGRGLNRSEFLQVTASETDLFVQVSLKRIEEDGEAGLLAVLTDATELKTLEAQFVQSQKMQAIGQLAGGVAHDFNNLLTAISGHCDLLLLRHDQGDPEYGDLVQIHQNANRAASLVGQLLAFSRKQTLQPETIDLRDTMSDLTHLLNRLVGERVRLNLRHGEVLPPIRVDKRQLEQVIMNLVVNARDAMPEGGEITIETEAVALEAELHRNRATIPAGDYVMVTVADQGIGIAPEKMTKIFEPFFTTKKTGEGTGLGLSTAYGIIKQTGGFIFADSNPGIGTVFTLYLPAHAAVQAPEATIATRAQPQTPRGGVVLLVEDEAPVRAFASRALRLQGLTVMEAESAEEALDVLSDADLSVDVFVTDVVMPGMDGPSWVRQALTTRPEARVVFVSGYAREALSHHEVDIPNSVFLPKPFSLQDLTATVQGQLV